MGLIALVIAGGLFAMHGLATNTESHESAPSRSLSHTASATSPIAGGSSAMHEDSDPHQCGDCEHNPMRHFGAACTMALLAIGTCVLAVHAARNGSRPRTSRLASRPQAFLSHARLQPLRPPDRFLLSVIRC